MTTTSEGKTLLEVFTGQKRLAERKKIWIRQVNRIFQENEERDEGERPPYTERQESFVAERYHVLLCRLYGMERQV